MPEWSRRDMTRARELYAKRKGSIDQLCAGNRPLTWRHREERRFMEALQEAAAWQFLKKPEAFTVHPARLELSQLPLNVEIPNAKDARRTARLGMAVLRQSGHRRRTYRIAGEAPAWLEIRHSEEAPPIHLHREFEGELGGMAATGLFLPRCRNGLYHIHRGLRFVEDRFIMVYGPRLAVPAPRGRVKSCTCGLTSPGIEFTEC